MKKFLLVAPGVALVFACSGGGPATISPGKWEFTTKINSIEMPGAPPQMIEQMKTKEQKATQCLTQDDVSKMGEKLTTQGAPGGGTCTYSRQTLANGTIDIAGTC